MDTKPKYVTARISEPTLSMLKRIRTNMISAIGRNVTAETVIIEGLTLLERKLKNG